MNIIDPSSTLRGIFIHWFFDYIKELYDHKVLEQVKEEADLHHKTILYSVQYPESMIQRCLEILCHLSGKTPKEVWYSFGINYFMPNVIAQYSYYFKEYNHSIVILRKLNTSMKPLFTQLIGVDAPVIEVKEEMKDYAKLNYTAKTPRIDFLNGCLVGLASYFKQYVETSYILVQAGNENRYTVECEYNKAQSKTA